MKLRQALAAAFVLAPFCVSAQARLDAQAAAQQSTITPAQVQASRDADRLSILVVERVNIARRLISAEKTNDPANAARAKADLEAIDREIALAKGSPLPRSPSSGVAQARPVSAVRTAVTRPRQDAGTGTGEFATWDVFKNFEKKDSQQ